MKLFQEHSRLAAAIFLSLLFLFSPLRCLAESSVVGFIASGSAVDDDSFNGMTVSGLRKLQRRFDLKIEVRSGGYSYDTFEKQVQDLVAGNAKIIVINSSNNHERILNYISRYPKIHFIMNDARISGYDNISSIAYGQRMGSCLVGALCAWQTKTGKVGFIGGNEHPVIKDFLCGFREGVRLAGKDVEIDVQYIRGGVTEQGFEDPRQANAIALQMYSSGVDIIYSVAGLSGNGVIQAARKTGNYVVGVDSDQDHMAKGTILTSMMKRLDVAVYNEVLSVLEGHFVPGTKEYNLSNGGVGLTEMKYTKQLISEEVLNRLSDLKEQLADGTVKLNCSVK